MKKILLLLALMFPAIHSVHTAAQDHSRPVITRQNADQVELLHVIGRGRIYDVDWSSDGEHIAVFSEYTVTVHNPEDLTDKQVLQIEPCDPGYPCRGTVDFAEDSQTLIVGGGTRITTYDADFAPLAVYEDDTDKSILFYSQPDNLLIYGGGPANAGFIVYQGFDPAIFHSDPQSLYFDAMLILSEGVPASIALSPDGQLLAVNYGLLIMPQDYLYQTYADRDHMAVYNLTATFEFIKNEEINFFASGFLDNHGLRSSPRGNSNGLTHVTFSPDSTLLAAAGQNGQVRLWSMPDGAEVAVFDGHYIAAWDVAFSPDGTQLVSAGGDGTIHFWDVATGEETLLISGLRTAISTISFNPDGSRLVAGAWDGSLWIFDTATGEIIDELKPYSLPAWTIAFSPDGTHFAIGTDGNDVVLFDVIDEPPFIIEKFTFYEHKGPVYAVAFHPDEPRLASGGSDGMTYVWNTETGILEESIETHPFAVIYGLAFNPRDGILHSGTSRSRGLQYDNVPRLSVSYEVTEPVYSVIFSPDATLFAYGDVQIDNLDLRTSLALEPQRGWSDAYSSSRTKLTFSTDGSVLLSAGTGQYAFVWHMDDMANTTKISQTALLALSPDGSLVAGRNLMIYDAETGQKIEIANQHVSSGWTYDAVFSPDGTIIVTADSAGGLRFWGIPAD